MAGRAWCERSSGAGVRDGRESREEAEELEELPGEEIIFSKKSLMPVSMPGRSVYSPETRI